MKIRFETTIDDVIAGSRYHYTNSPTWRRQVLVTMVSVPILAALVPIVLVTSDSSTLDPLLMACTFLAISTAWVLFVRWSMNRTLDGTIRKLLAEGTNQGILGWRAMGLEPGSWWEATPFPETSTLGRSLGFEPVYPWDRPRPIPNGDMMSIQPLHLTGPAYVFPIPHDSCSRPGK